MDQPKQIDVMTFNELSAISQNEQEFSEYSDDFIVVGLQGIIESVDIGISPGPIHSVVNYHEGRFNFPIEVAAYKNEPFACSRFYRSKPAPIIQCLQLPNRTHIVADDGQIMLKTMYIIEQIVTLEQESLVIHSAGVYEISKRIINNPHRFGKIEFTNFYFQKPNGKITESDFECRLIPKNRYASP